MLADGTQTIFTADMSGDGLTDIVRVRNGEACYWPNTGYGHFGAKVTMDGAARFDNEERFDGRRIRLADIDGSGTADLLYIGQDGVTAWFNQSGNAWSTPAVIGVFPAADRLSSVQALDLLGTGTACLVWSSPLPGDAPAPLRYVDLMSGRKPHLMTGVRNNLGAETRVSYAPSTRFYVADETAGTPWVTKLAFPVQVVERVETIDWIGRDRLVTRYAYHHGYFDGYEREFRGFGLVEQWDTEEFRADTAFDDDDFVNWDTQSWSPPMLTRTWYHTGAFLNAPEVSQRYVSEYWIEPALRAPGMAASAAAMRPPDTVLPDGLGPFEVQEAYRALKGHALRIETYACDGIRRRGQPVHRDRAELHGQLPAAHGPEPSRGVLRQPARDGVVPLRARPGRPADRPRVHPGDRRVRQRAAQRLGRIPAPGRVRAARAVADRRPSRRCSPTTRGGCTSAARPAATPTRRRPDRVARRLPGTAGGVRRRGGDHRGRPRGQGQPGSPACSPSTRSTGRAASGRRCGPGRTTCRTSRSPAPTSTGAAPRPPRRPAGSSPASGSCTGETT